MAAKSSRLAITSMSEAASPRKGHVGQYSPPAAALACRATPRQRRRIRPGRAEGQRPPPRFGDQRRQVPPGAVGAHHEAEDVLGHVADRRHRVRPEPGVAHADAAARRAAPSANRRAYGHPAGLATSARMPTTPDAPSRVATTTVWPSCWVKLSASARASGIGAAAGGIGLDDGQRPVGEGQRGGRRQQQRRRSEARWPHSSKIATARVQPAEPWCTFTGKQETMKPAGGSASRLCSFSMWQ